MATIRPPGSRLSRWAPGAVMGAHAHAAASLCFLIEGGYAEETLGRRTDHRPGDLLALPGDTPHAQQISAAGALKLILAPSEAAIDILQAEPDFAQAPALRSETVAALGRRLARELAEPDDFSPLVREGLEIEAAALFCRGLRRERLPAPPPWLKAARDRVVGQLDAPASLDEVARAVGRHPAHLARAFRRSYGTSLGEYARRQRLETAARLLRTGAMPLAEIALTCGFHDQAHLSRAFKLAFGQSPAAWRRLFV
ncbi:AraC family transcriptional regulator [Caulobacter ginsengisoli]|uniref:AraC family transcriptional regulator n=1 Tax=Caulobacter ginsengisoli TaxID=400775 RepID=A0ABU0IWJ5_9CAUL|nr:AraC family transcriptional regulator [Caulobacter ginsengisoli]MDQ0465317.1 AraC family transcriptional regulator [Caulobacter ginsengisoli]